MMLINVLGKLLQHIIPPITNHESIEEKKSHENLDHINLYICIDVTYFTGFQYIYIYIYFKRKAYHIPIDPKENSDNYGNLEEEKKADGENVLSSDS